MSRTVMPSGSRPTGSPSVLTIWRSRTSCSIGAECTAEVARPIADGSVDDRAGVDDFERGTGDRLELIEVVVVPARIGRTGDEPVRPVVGIDQSVLLERDEDHARLTRESRDVVAR